MRTFLSLLLCLAVCAAAGCYAARRDAHARHSSAAESEAAGISSTGKVDRLTLLMQEMKGQRDVTELVDEFVAIGQPAVPGLVKLLKTGTKIERSNVMYVLARMKTYPAEAIPVIEGLLDEKDADRVHIAVDLQRIDPSSARAMSVLAEEMKKSDVSTRVIIVKMLSLNHDVDKCLPVLLGAMADMEPDVRSAAAQTLGEIGLRNKAAGAAMVPALTKALEDQSPSVRMEAARALGLLGEPAKSSLPALQKKAGDKREKEKVKKAAATAINLINVEKPKKSRGGGNPLLKPHE